MTNRYMQIQAYIHNIAHASQDARDKLEELAKSCERAGLTELLDDIYHARAICTDTFSRACNIRDSHRQD